MKNDMIQNEPETVGQLFVSAFYDLFDIVVPALLVVSLVFLFLFRTAGVDGNSMNTTLNDTDRLLMTNFLYEPQRGDIVIINRFHPGDKEVEEPLIKRVIGVAGDRVRVENKAVYLNGKKLAEPYVNDEYINDPRLDEVVVPEGCIFVMGDHRDDSMDSRQLYLMQNDFFSVNDVMGKAVWRILPAKDFGTVYYNLPSGDQ